MTPDPTPEGLGMVVGSATPPLDAVAILTVSGLPHAFAAANAGETCRLHLDDSQDPPTGLDDYENEPNPRTDEDLAVVDLDGDPHATATVSEYAWVTLTADGDTRGRVTVRPPEQVALHLVESDALDVSIDPDGRPHDDARGGVDTGQTTTQDGDAEVTDA